MNRENPIIIATNKPWNIKSFAEIMPYRSNWHIITSPSVLSTFSTIEDRIRYIFFPHWSWRVPDEILDRFECVCFHMTDVPFGRGGSPLQNLIARGHKETMLTALRMVSEMDAGPLYMKRPLALAGSAQEIYERASALAFTMMAEIAEHEPQPIPQVGEPTYFKRRTPEMSALPQSGTIESIYDHIRMLDAESYPRAFLRHGEYRLIFDRAKLSDGGLEARVRITKEDDSA